MKEPNSFHSSMRDVLIIAQVIGLLPIKGILGPKFTFTWTNPLNLYGLIVTGVTIFFDVCYTIDNMKTEFGIDVYASTVFYTVCILTTLMFLEIAVKFPEISSEFEKLEKEMADYGYPEGLALKIKGLLYIFLILAGVEHAMMIWASFSQAWTISGQTGQDIGPVFYSVRFIPISKRVPYSNSLFFCLFLVNVICTLNWNYLDFFLISMSLEISQRFAQVNSKLARAGSKEGNWLLYAKIYHEYNQLSLVTRQMDKHLGKIILTSFFSNMYHLSLQLNRSLKLKGTLFQMTYFYFSLFYLIARLLLVLFLSSGIHDESKKCAEFLVGLENRPTEATRFLHRVINDDIALTGNKFFIITRKFLVSVIGTIITYQAFLLQFNSLINNEWKVEQ